MRACSLRQCGDAKLAAAVELRVEELSGEADGRCYRLSDIKAGKIR